MKILMIFQRKGMAA
uniref:Uncharacterized protein n=1 Tax=Vitis vinifera TaxID=29760 RepID=F6GZ76_VITVI